MHKKLRVDYERKNRAGTEHIYRRMERAQYEKQGILLDFIARPGVTYSLRAVHAEQKEKDLFVMVDVIEDVERWLSVCFFGNMITDPEERKRAGKSKRKKRIMSKEEEERIYFL